MGVGVRIQRLRVESHRTQRSVADAAGMAVEYLSRIENDRVIPTIRTLGKLAGALDVPMAAVFGEAPVLEATDRCPVSLSGRCVLDHLFVGRGRPRKVDAESYSSEQLEALRLCNLLLHTGNRALVRTLVTLLQSLRDGVQARPRRVRTTGKASRAVRRG